MNGRWLEHANIKPAPFDLKDQSGIFETLAIVPPRNATKPLDGPDGNGHATHR
jgi:hypothetical protein